MKRVYKSFLSLLLVLMLALCLTGCGRGERLMFGTGGTAGTYYAYGGILSQK